MIKLTANGKKIDTAQMERLFTQGEAFSDRICIQIDTVNNDVDVSGCTFIMRTAASDGSMTETLLTKELQEEVIILTWDVPDTVTAVPGPLRLELVGTEDASVIIKYRMPPIFIKEAVMGTNIPVPDVIEEKLALMNELLENMPEAINQEVIDARAGCFSDYTYATLQQRLNAEFSACVRQNAFEQTVSALSVKDNELAADYETLLREIVIARTDYGDGQTWGSLGSRLGADFGAVWATFDKHTNQINSLEVRTLTTLGAPLKKNLLKNTASTATTNGVTFTVNSDGSVTANGTATEAAFFNIPYNHTGEARAVILSGCPEGGSGDTYMMRADKAGTIVARDYGSGTTISADNIATVTYVAIRINAGYTADNLVFRPMIRYADITDSTYEPYTPSLQEQIDELKAQIAAMTANS